MLTVALRSKWSRLQSGKGEATWVTISALRNLAGIGFAGGAGGGLFQERQSKATYVGLMIFSLG